MQARTDTNAMARFLGDYSVARNIEDRLTGDVVRFVGGATLMREAGSARFIYSETGDMVQSSGARFRAERRYYWQPKGAQIEVLFDDGRTFHCFDAVDGGLASEHLCGADMYRGGYDLSNWPYWSVRWAVSGPRKDYISVTHYAPC